MLAFLLVNIKQNSAVAEALGHHYLGNYLNGLIMDGHG